MAATVSKFQLIQSLGYYPLETTERDFISTRFAMKWDSGALQENFLLCTKQRSPFLVFLKFFLKAQISVGGMNLYI